MKMPGFLALPVFKIPLLAGVLFASVLGLTGYVISEKTGQKPLIIWQEQLLERTLTQGDRISKDIGFITNKDLTDVRVWIAPEIEKYVFARPIIFDQIPAGSVVRVQVIFIIPPELEPGAYDGTIHIKQGMRTLAKPLPVSFTVLAKPEPSPTPPPEPVELFYDDGTAEGFDFDPVFGRAVYFTKFVSAGESTKILNAKIFVKKAVEVSGLLAVYIWDFNRQQLIPPITAAVTSDGWLYVDVSPYNLAVSNEFYIGVAWPSSEAPSLLGVDLNSPQGKSYLVFLATNTFIPVTNSNFMIRAIVEKI